MLLACLVFSGRYSLPVCPHPDNRLIKQSERVKKTNFRCMINPIVEMCTLWIWPCILYGASELICTFIMIFYYIYR